MPITVPSLDDRRYQQLLDEALARIPVHTPEWTNFNKSDPGVTLIEVFAFLTENLLYRANLIPERSRLKFLSLLGIPLYPAAAAQGMVTFTNERGPLRTLTLNDDLEVRAGQIPFRTTLGLDVLPIEVRGYYKREQTIDDPKVKAYYEQLYASYIGTPPLNASSARIYETRPFPSQTETGINLSDTIDRSLWLAVLLRADARPYTHERREEIRRELANRILSLGIVPLREQEQGRDLKPVGQESTEGGALLRYQIPDMASGESLPLPPAPRIPRYTSLPAVPTGDVLANPGIVQLRLPAAERLRLWDNIDPLEMGVGDFPPTLEDTALNDRLITWIRITSPAAVQASFLWVGANAALVEQRARLANELLPGGTGEPDQVVTLSRAPVIADSVRLRVTVNNQTETWARIDDLFAAGAEVPVPDPRLPPGTPPPKKAEAKVFTLNPEAGEIRFGDGMHGARPPFGATIRADYDYAEGAEGNVGADAINTGAALPAGLKVTNPVPTWGGAEAENANDGEKQITRYLQHRDRAVTIADFDAITRRTPGVDVGRVEVLPTFNPEIGSSEPGDAPGAVTLMLIPRYDPARPNAPMPDNLFMDAVCAHLNPRRLVTTEVFLRPPNYRAVWVSIGITAAPRVSIAQVIEDVKTTVTAFFSPLPRPESAGLEAENPLFTAPEMPDPAKGWPLRKTVRRLEIAAVANRVAGVLLVNGVTLLDETRNPREDISMSGLDLPYLAGIVVGLGEPPDPSSIPGFGGASGGTGGDGAGGLPTFAPVPAIPEECR